MPSLLAALALCILYMKAAWKGLRWFCQTACGYFHLHYLLVSLFGVFVTLLPCFLLLMSVSLLPGVKVIDVMEQLGLIEESSLLSTEKLQRIYQERMQVREKERLNGSPFLPVSIVPGLLVTTDDWFHVILYLLSNGSLKNLENFKDRTNSKKLRGFGKCVL